MRWASALRWRRRIRPADEGCSGRGGCGRRAGVWAGCARIWRAYGSADGFTEGVDALADGVRVGRDGGVVRVVGVEGERRLTPKEQNKKRRTKMSWHGCLSRR
jgi:hypothetical protein